MNVSSLSADAQEVYALLKSRPAGIFGPATVPLARDASGAAQQAIWRELVDAKLVMESAVAGNIACYRPKCSR
jgi:rhamnogalacturonyl hydrolase YesR